MYYQNVALEDIVHLPPLLLRSCVFGKLWKACRVRPDVCRFAQVLISPNLYNGGGRARKISMTHRAMIATFMGITSGQKKKTGIII